MGSGISSPVPERLDIKAFAELSGDRFDRNFFYAFKDQATGTISKQKFLEFADVTDVYFSYFWGADEEGDQVQDRVGAMAIWLLQRGLICHFHGDIQSYQSGHQNVQKEIDNSQVFISCVTHKYINRVNRIEDAKPNKNSYEFNHAKRTKSYDKMIFLILDRSVLHLSSWSDLTESNNIETINIHDFTVDENLDLKYEVLYQNVINLVTPLRLVSFFSQANERAKMTNNRLKSEKLKSFNSNSYDNRNLYSDSYAIAAAAVAIADAFNEPFPINAIDKDFINRNTRDYTNTSKNICSIDTILDMPSSPNFSPTQKPLPDVYQNLRLQIMKMSLSQKQFSNDCSMANSASSTSLHKSNSNGDKGSSGMVLVTDKKAFELETTNKSTQKAHSLQNSRSRTHHSSLLQSLKNKTQVRSSTKNQNSF